MFINQGYYQFQMARDHLTLEECITLAKKVDRWDFVHYRTDFGGGLFTGKLYRLNFALERGIDTERDTKFKLAEYGLTIKYCPEIIRVTVEERGTEFRIKHNTPLPNDGIELATFRGHTLLKKLYDSFSRKVTLMTPGEPIIIRETSGIAEEGFRYADKFL